MRLELLINTEGLIKIGDSAEILDTFDYLLYFKKSKYFCIIYYKIINEL